ncbi:hypothetical protein D1872_298770 [compost metagenome]
MAAMAVREMGRVSLKANSMSSMLAAWAAITTSPEVGASMMAAGEAHTAAAAPREIPMLTISGNRVAISSTPRPVAELTASDMAQATR